MKATAEVEVEGRVEVEVKAQSRIPGQGNQSVREKTEGGIRGLVISHAQECNVHRGLP